MDEIVEKVNVYGGMSSKIEVQRMTFEEFKTECEEHDSVRMDPFGKYTGGFEGDFADVDTFFGGLTKLIGEPQKDVGGAMEREHCRVRSGFGASDSWLTGENYGVRFTPRIEYKFVADDSDSTEMDAGLNPVTKAPLGKRTKVTVDSLLANAVQRIGEDFRRMHWGKHAPTAEAFALLCVTREEVVGMRLYTSPMYFVYNTVLRVTAKEGMTIDHGVPAEFLGCCVRGLFTTTLHAINSGVIKLSRVQPACDVYRGMKGMKLPRSFVEAKNNVRGGVEHGFLSATMDFEEAVKYTRGGPETPSLVFQMRMGMVNRGAPHAKRCSVPGSWVGVRRRFHFSLFLTSSRMALPKILVLTARTFWEPHLSASVIRHEFRGVLRIVRRTATRLRRGSTPRKRSGGHAIPKLRTRIGWTHHGLG